MPGWTLQTEPVELFREPPDVRSGSYLTPVFERRDGKWRMVQDQNTPIK